MKGLQWALVLGSVGAAACAGAPPPHEREASSAAAIRSAEEVGAERIPQAALHLKLAHEQFDKGKALMSDGDNSRADYVLLRAQADAELALAFARENKTRTDAQTLIERVRTTRGGQPLQAPTGNPPTSQNSVQ